MVATNGDDVAARDQDVACLYCRKSMVRVVLGWHCPGCHGSLGEVLTASR
jgi:hypothetical protein